MIPARDSSYRELVHRQPEIEATPLNTKALVEVGVDEQVSASYTPGFTGKCKTAFRILGAPSLQSFASLSSKVPAPDRKH